MTPSAGWDRVGDDEAAEMRADVFAEAAEVADRAADLYRRRGETDRARVAAAISTRIRHITQEDR